MEPPSNTSPALGDRIRPEERRQARRWKVFKNGWLVLQSGLTPCSILDITDNGARLQIPDAVKLPQTLRVFIVGDEVMMDVHRVWSTLDQMGVTFIDR